MLLTLGLQNGLSVITGESTRFYEVKTHLVAYQMLPKRQDMRAFILSQGVRFRMKTTKVVVIIA
jgi:hypothetical protein